jgi:pyruvate, water dikinase
MNKESKYILWFDEISIEDVPIVGGKNASLGEMYRNLTRRGVKVPNGFAITADSYRYLLEKDQISKEITNSLKNLDINNLEKLAEKGSYLRKLIKNAEIPEDLEKQIIDAYYKLSKQENAKEIDVAVRSSATAEDLEDASFAGQQETYLNIRGPEDLLDACRKCFASLFTNRAIAYRVEKKFDHTKVALSITVQKMVRSDLAASGVMFSIDTETGFKDVVVINGAYGLGENVVQGAVNPDEYMVFKPTLKLGKKPIISKRLGEKAIKMVYDNQGNKSVKNINVDINHRHQYCLDDKQVITLAKWACIIEEYYSQKAGHYKPMDMEWALDGKTKQLYIVQARPETVQANKNLNKIETYSLLDKKEPIITGISIGQKIITGKASIIKDVKDINNFKKGDILITEMTDPDWVPIMKIASGIVTNKGGRTCFSGDTKILTNKGLLTLKEIYDNNLKNLYTPSLNKKTLKVEWKKITDVMKRKDKLISISCTQKNKNTKNILKVTPDHKMVNIRDSKIEDTEVNDMLLNKECVLVPETIPRYKRIKLDLKEGYLLGALFTDGCVRLDKRHGCVYFIQKPIKEKLKFINYFKSCFKKVYNYDLKESEKKESNGFIRGCKVIGKANMFRCYKKEICKKILSQRENLLSIVLSADKEYLFNFLAGVIDGDGSYNNGRVNIYISKEDLSQAVVISLLRLGIVPQVTKNRTIKNIQVVENLDIINKYTKRVNCKDLRNVGYSFFNTKQLFSDKFNREINNRVSKNLLVDKKYLKLILKDIKNNSLKKNLKKLIDSSLRQKRIVLDKRLGISDVYNITVKDNHTYFVFTSNYTPIAVNNCHAAIIARELGIPCIVGTIDATLKIKDKQMITLNCSSGDYGFVYDKVLKYKKETQDITSIPDTKTKIMLNVGSPEQAFEQSFLPSDGVGLAREEFIINSWIKIHPLALINYAKLKDKNLKHEIDKLTIGYKDKEEYFVDKLSQGIARIAAAFYPKKVILRTSDFKTDEYANLIGGKEYEPIESNPMIGWRGASRYYQGNYREGFALECKAIKRVREEMGLLNLEIMIPFCRTVDEAKKVILELKNNGLKQGANGLKVICMCEIPSNVILAHDFMDIFDGFSIGSNDLTQLTLGLDRNSEIVASIYDERNKAVKELITNVVKIAKKKKKYIGICGQAPSDYPDFAEFLVSIGIDSMSLNPDTLVKTKMLVSKKEKKR